MLEFLFNLFQKSLQTYCLWMMAVFNLQGNEEFEFDCQHGETECEGNKVHACATKYLEESGPLTVNSTPDEINSRNRLLTLFVACMIKENRHPMKIARNVRQKNKKFNSI